MKATINWELFFGRRLSAFERDVLSGLKQQPLEKLGEYEGYKN